MKTPLSLGKKEKRLGKRAYLAYQHLGVKHYAVSKNGKALVIGVHVNPADDGYCVTRA